MIGRLFFFTIVNMTENADRFYHSKNPPALKSIIAQKRRIVNEVIHGRSKKSNAIALDFFLILVFEAGPVKNENF